MKHFPEIQLSFEETRVLGVLLEKEVLTPDAYPLTLNSIVTACNQSSSRHPVTSLSGDDIQEALRELSEKYLIEKILGGRTAKYAHCLPHVLSMQDTERAVLTVLLLRGAQTAGEIKQRTERMHQFDSLDEVEETLTWFIEYPYGPLVHRIAAGGGRRVETFEHLLSRDLTPSHPSELAGEQAPTPAAIPPAADENSSWQEQVEARLFSLEQQVAELRAHLEDQSDL